MDQNLMYPTAAAAVEAFVAQRLANTDESGAAFTSDQLRFYVNNNMEKTVSPSTADRVLRDLRKQGKLDYLVLNRGRSLYRAVPLGTTSN